MGDRVKIVTLHASPIIAKMMFKSRPTNWSGMRSCTSPLDRNMPFKKVALIWELFVVTENVIETSLRSELMSPDSSSLSSPSVGKSEEYDVGLVE